MSRLFGLYCEEPVKLSCKQVAPVQADSAQGKSQETTPDADGWGVGFYRNKGSFLFKKASRNSKTQRITNITEVISSNIFISHLRHATVGDRKEANTHPFRWGNWLYAHLGTINHFRRMRSRILRKLPPAYKKQIQGNTDSEHTFYLYLSLLKKEGAIKKGDIPLDSAVKGLQNFRSILVDFHKEAEIDEMSELNLLVSNGSYLIAARCGSPLYYHYSEEIKPEEASFYSDTTWLKYELLDFDPDKKLVVVSSEKLHASEQWQEIPDNHIFTINSNQEISIQPWK